VNVLSSLKEALTILACLLLLVVMVVAGLSMAERGLASITGQQPDPVFALERVPGLGLVVEAMGHRLFVPLVTDEGHEGKR